VITAGKCCRRAVPFCFSRAGEESASALSLTDQWVPLVRVLNIIQPISISVFLLNKKTETLKINNSLENDQKNVKPILLA